MAVRDILLDTNAYAAFKRGMPDAVEIIRHVQLIGINSVVLGELLGGFAVGSREAANREELKRFLAPVEPSSVGGQRFDLLPTSICSSYNQPIPVPQERSTLLRITK